MTIESGARQIAGIKVKYAATITAADLKGKLEQASMRGPLCGGCDAL